MWWVVEKWKPAVGAKGAQTCTGLQTKTSPTAPYCAVHANLRKFAGIFWNGADVALMQGAHEHEAKGVGSWNLHHAVKYPWICANSRWRHYTTRCKKAFFASPYRFGHHLHQLQVFIFQLLILLASCSCALWISATSAQCRKAPANLRKFPLTALYGAMRKRLDLQARAGLSTFAPTVCFLFSTSYPISFMFICTLH